VPERTAPVLLGVDLGTTAVKAAVRGADGRAFGRGVREHALATPQPDAVELSPDGYWRTFVEATTDALRQAQVDPRRIAALALSCQGETLVAVDAQGEPLRPAIVWLDNRAAAEASELAERFPPQRLYEVTGQPAMLPTWPAAKLLWLARHEPEIFEGAARFLLLEDWFLWRLAGVPACEGSLATSTCYWDFRKKTWWSEMLEALGLDPGRLGELVEPGSPIGALRPAAAAELGLPASVTVCAGALDQACGAIGVGNTAPGVLSENTGAAVAICATLDGPRLDPERRLPCHYHGMPDAYMFHTFTTGGMALRWFRDEFCESERAVARLTGADPYDVLAAEASRTPPGAEGLVVLPHLQGAMAPESDPSARGAMVGFTLRHGRAHVARAVLESVAFVIRRTVEVLEELDVRVETIRALGGGARSALWKQIEADVTHKPVVVTEDPDAATLGACVLAGCAIGLYGDIGEAASSMVRVAATYEPDRAASARYDDAYARYRATYEALRPVFAKEEPCETP
jgi:sugar (pentulose or hexulose) kinase